MGELSSAEAGPAELRVRLRMSAAQARASAPENLPSPAPGFQGASCSLFLDPAGVDPPNIVAPIHLQMDGCITQMDGCITEG